jgi:hypothetical protein
MLVYTVGCVNVGPIQAGVDKNTCIPTVEEWVHTLDHLASQLTDDNYIISVYIAYAIRVQAYRMRRILVII